MLISFIYIIHARIVMRMCTLNKNKFGINDNHGTLSIQH